jgi:negative regulator of sigma E activity
MRKVAFPLIVSLLLGLSQASAAQTTAAPEDLLQKMLLGNHAFYATIVIGVNNELSTATMNLNANALEIRRLDGGNANVFFSLPIQQLTLANELSKTLGESYSAQWQGHERIADRNTRRVMFVPKDGWRYRYQLWLDEQTGLALKRQLFRQQQMIEQITTTAIEFESAHRNTATSAPANNHAFQVRNLPDGFVQIAAYTHSNRAQQVFSDGLAKVSIFVQAAGQFPSNAHAQRGAIGMLAKRIGNVEYIAIGDVPEPTLARFLSDVQPARD